MKIILNDVHSQLNSTEVAQILRPRTLADLQKSIRQAAAENTPLSVAGGRHAMGGQQFLVDAVHIDMTGLDRVLATDSILGLLHIEAGADWPKIIADSHAMPLQNGATWGIRQKQTCVDAVSLGGSISAKTKK